METWNVRNHSRAWHIYATFLENVYRMSKCLGNLQAEEDGPRTKEKSFGDILTMRLTSEKVYGVI